MNERRQIMYLLLLAALVPVNLAQSPPGSWGSPPFVSMDEERIKIGSYSEEGALQRVTMWEEIPVPFQMIKLNYLGERIDIQIQDDGLGAQIIRDETGWIIVIHNRIDYEQPSHRLYMITLSIDGDKSNVILIPITLLNILDNAPVMSADNDCVIEEGRENFLSGCSYTVRHEDGFEVEGIVGTEGSHTNALTFKLPDEETEFFEFQQTATLNEFSKQFTLKVLKPLDYTLRAVYSFSVTVYDYNNTHNFTMNLVVQVQNVESRSPIFTRPFTTQRILEKETFETTVIAIDGDTGLNRPICYRMDVDEQKYEEYFNITEQTGVLSVEKIDRDAEKNEFYKFTISAYKCHNSSYITTIEAAIILDDKNDNSPVFDVTPTELSFWENTVMELPLDWFFVEDIDLGAHATYDVKLHEKVSGSDLPGAESFSIVPTSGYQLASFTLTIVSAAKLDYELPERQQFQLIVTATEQANISHIAEQVLDIELRNWNDEVPSFDQDTYEITINETIGKDYPLLQVDISDRDIDDNVTLHILSRINNNLKITRLDSSAAEAAVPVFSFEISTLQNDLFDYDVASEVIVQLEARDTLQTEKNEPIHQVFAQVVITVLDVNNKPPSITTPQGRMHIAENSAPNTPITIGELDAEIIGTDPDTTAKLIFSIDWTRSFGVKGGLQVSPEVFEGCLVFDVDDADRNRVIGKIRVNPDLDQETINQKLDYEKYETLFLTVILEDTNQVIPPGDTETIVVVQIEDVNDNAPEFVGNTLQIERYVLEEAETRTIVGTITATDKDGPQFNQISYTVTPQNTDHEGWIMIDSLGMLLVNATEKPIDCDDPITYTIPLNITLTDGLFTTEGSFEIAITDTNNKLPAFQAIPNEVKIFEKSTSGTKILLMEVIDLDRDEPFHTVAFEIDNKNTELQYYFEVNRITEAVPANQRTLQTGEVVVKENNRILDRDSGTDTFTITVKAQDNPNSSGRRNTDEVFFTLILLDINDQTPQLPVHPELLLSENAVAGAAVVERFEATDRDDRNTPNAKINYRLVNITAAGDNSLEATANQETVDSLFTVSQTDQYVARFGVGTNLKGFYGSWTVGIEACDRGDEYELKPDSPRLCSSATYTVRVEPVNYMAPVINYPTEGARIRLKFESLANGRPLVNVQGETIPNFAATDTDGGDFGVVTFTLQSQNANNQDHVYFALNTLDKHQAQLVLVNADAVEAKTYNVIVTAVDGGNLSSEPVNVVLVFIDMTGEPAFEITVFDTDFTENELGLEEVRTIPAAVDPKNAELPPEENQNVFYFIDTSHGTSSHLFQLNKETRELRLTQELDREEIASHEIRVIATNNINGPTTPTPADSSAALIVRVKVNDVNDNPPKFRSNNYSAGITPNDYSGKILLTVVADDPDEDDVVSYSIDADSLEVHGTNLPTSPIPFSIGKENGQLSLATQMQNTMKGFYTFTIVATDLVDHTATASVKIYLITESNRVKFVFLNYKSEVDTPEMRSFLEEQFGAHYETDCNIDDIVQGSLDEVARADEERVTNVRAHFIRDNEAVEAIEIQQRSNDRVFVTNLKTALSARQLLLQDVPITSDETIDEKSELLQIVLIVVASALAGICIILLVAFCVKIRSLNRQLKALSATDFVSIASDINGGRKVPTTNVFSVEGSNPVLNDREFPKSAFDDISVQSYESDFIGIDNDLFATKRRDDELNPQLIEHIKQRSLNPMVNGGSAAGITLRRETESSTDELTHKF